MKKFIFALSTLLLIFCLSFIGINPNAASNVVEVDGATYEVKKNLITQDLGYGVTHVKDIAQSSASNLHDYDSCGPKNTLVGQQVNVLTVESSKTTRIVNWTYMTNDGWTTQTVRTLAENFEIHNPGWKVIAAVNGDFFDINAKMALPYQGNGVHVSNGEVYRPSGSVSNVGFKNDGSDDPLVGGVPCEVSALTLAIYDENENIIKEFVVDKINEEVQDGELGVWFTYNVMLDNVELGTKERTEVPITTKENNTFVVAAPERCLPISKTQVYGKGNISSINNSVTLRFGQFAIETTNSEITSYLQVGTQIRIQQNLVGAFAECDNVTGAGIQMLANGEVTDQKDLDRHPRTCVGIKADGSIVLFTVDGRQFEKNMYGMCSSEMAAALLNYGCVEAYNLDGGGSTTMIIRNEYGDFDVLNSPSDGNERNDSNALLVVVPDVSLSINEVNDTSASFSYTPSKDYTVSNIKLQIGDQIINVKENETNFVFENLTKQTAYSLNYTFDIIYKDEVTHDLSGDLKFATGKTVPHILGLCYEETDDEYIFHFNINDPDNTLSQCFIKYDRSLSMIYDYNETTFTLSKSSVTNPVFELNYKYNIQSTPSKMITKKVVLFLNEQHQINYVLDGGTNDENNKSSYNTYELVGELGNAHKPGYSFIGWFDSLEDGNQITKLSDITEEVTTLYARFSLNTYNINYELDGGINDSNNPSTYCINDGTITLHNPTKEGFNFLGWKLNGEFVKEISSEIASDITLTAVFEKIIIKHTITYNLNGGENNSSNPTEYVEGEGVELLPATKDGYTFKGWELNGEIVNRISGETSEDVTLSAVFEKLEEPTKKGCSCKKNANLVIALTSSLSLLVIVLRKKH